MALKCCNRVCQLIETIALYDTEHQRHRVLVVGRCKNPKCGALRGEFIYWDTVQGKFKYIKVPKNELKEVLDKFKRLPYLVYQKETKRQGTMSNMSWTYQKNGSIYDFNETFISKIETEMKLYEQNE